MARAANCAHVLSSCVSVTVWSPLSWNRKTSLPSLQEESPSESRRRAKVKANKDIPRDMFSFLLISHDQYGTTHDGTSYLESLTSFRKISQIRGAVVGFDPVDAVRSLRCLQLGQRASGLRVCWVAGEMRFRRVPGMAAGAGAASHCSMRGIPAVAGMTETGGMRVKATVP